MKNIPLKGPVILAGNHVEVLESAFLNFYGRRIVEPIGAGDIPFDGFLDNLVNAYGFIPVDRGTVDRSAMREMQQVLQDGAVLAIFPEGGTWRPGMMQVQIGVSLLSERANAPVVPIGFSGFLGSWAKTKSFKRPKLTMRIGKPIPPLVLDPNGPPTKDQMQAYADGVMREVYKLVDQEEVNNMPAKLSFDFTVKRGTEEQGFVTLPAVEGGEAFVDFVHMPVINETLHDSLKLPTKAFFPKEGEDTRVEDFLTAIDATLEFLKEKPNFFNYRMGRQEGEDVVKVLHFLRTLLLEAQAAKETILLEGHVSETSRGGTTKEKDYSFRLVP